MGSFTIEYSDAVKNLGFTMDRNLTYEKQINSVVKVCNFQLKNISHIRKHIDFDSCVKLVNGLVHSHLDYCNSMYYKTSKAILKKTASSDD
jgi:hypothetical protein